MLRKILFISLLILMMSTPCHASITEMGTGMLFGENHSFFITAPQGWVLDNKSGASQGVYMIFYPVGQTWRDSPVMAYGKSTTKNEKIKTIEDHVNKVINDFHNHGSPDYVGARQPSIFLPDGKEVVIYFFEGDQWGNYEAAAYFEEESTINYLVFNARTKRMFDIHLPGFKKLILTYRNAYIDKDNAPDEENFKKLVATARRCAESPAGGKYEKQVIEFLGQDVATYLRDCTSFLSQEKITAFDIVMKIEPDGTISETHIRPSNSLSVCFRGLITNRKLPEHDLGDYFLHLAIRIKE